MSSAATAKGEFRTAADQLAEESDPVEILRRVRKLTDEQDRLQRWMQGHERRISKLETRTSRLCATCGMIHAPGGACP